MAAVRWLVVWTVTCFTFASANMLPVFIKDMNNLALSESTPVGTKVYTLEAQDPEGLPILYGLKFTDKFTVDPETGDVTLAKPLDREVEDTIKFEVSIEEQNPNGDNLSQTQPVTVIVLDENDNAPVFRNSPYEVDVPEDEKIGTTILRGIEVEDRDDVGDNLEVGCVPNDQWPEACDIFEVVSLHSTANQYSGALVLKKPLDYNENQIFQFQLYAYDGALNSSAHVEVKVVDVQNSPPVFSGSLSAALSEDAPVGTLALTVKARDADRAQPRNVTLELITSNAALSEDAPVEALALTVKARDADRAQPRNVTLELITMFSGSLSAALSEDAPVETLALTVKARDADRAQPRNVTLELITIFSGSLSAALSEDAPVGTLALTVKARDADRAQPRNVTLELITSNAALSEDAPVGTLALTVKARDADRAQPRNVTLELITMFSGSLSAALSEDAPVGTLALTVKARDADRAQPRNVTLKLITIFSGSLSAALSEDDPVGTLALTVKARDADRAQPRNVTLELITNPLDFFVLDRTSGELRTAKPLDREALADPSSPLNLTVKATELVNGVPLDSPLTTTTATITVTIKDVNDEPPRFNRREYSLQIPESLPIGTPLPNLDMVVSDTDVGLNSVFGLRLSDELGAFVVEPATATGTASVTLRLNRTLDYEDPNQRKFILQVIAEELHTSPRLSSKASVTITLTDVNDNAPQFSDGPYTASVAENAPAGTWVLQVKATDRDTGRFGTEGIVYQLSGNGAELFNVDPKSGVITVAPCQTPGVPPCLDFESRKDYSLQLKATDDDGTGQSTGVSLLITLTDSNDNPPVFTTPVYKASIDEDAVKFEPELQVQARDIDTTSEIRYSIVDPEDHPFWIDPLNGRITVLPESGGVSTNSSDNKIILTVLATDGVHNATCKVEISVRDVNNHAPIFEFEKYDADISEDAPIGTQVAVVQATDMDSGINSEIKYAVQKGAYDAFAIDNITGVVTVSSQLDYDKKNTYRIQIIATDLGMPSLTGTTELTVHVSNVNDKRPYFTPTIQRAEVSADAELGTIVHTLAAIDPDIVDPTQLVFDISTEKLIRAVDKNGKEVTAEGIFGAWFTVLGNGSVIVSQKLDRSRAAVLTLPVSVIDASAPTLQQADGELIINIVDVNRHAPVFSQVSYHERLVEEQPVGTVLNTYTATDKETPISAIVIQPPNPYFQINNVTGVVKSTQRLDFEKVHFINFTLVAYDSGVPQLSSSAEVVVEVVNANDEEPKFAATEYYATVAEHSPAGTKVVTVTAVDKDEGEYGEVRYSLSGDLASLFTIDPLTGEVTVADGAVIDREVTTDIWLHAVVSDNAPAAVRKSNSVVVHIKVLDINDNAPVFTQNVYKSTIAENLQLNPPATILQVQAEDKDEGVNGRVEYQIVDQSEPGVFTVDPHSGIIYPAKNVTGNTTYHLTVTATDGDGAGPHIDTARVDISVLSVNRHRPVFVEPKPDVKQLEIPEDLINTARVDISVLSVNRHRPVFVEPKPDVKQLEIPENAAQSDYLITTIKATDEDSGDNGRVSYYLKVDNQNVGETAEFSIDRDTGELRTKTFLDREHRADYQLVIAAVDNGNPPHENLLVLTVVLTDENDNLPHFSTTHHQFSVRENLAPGVIVGSVKAIDKDAGDNGLVYYHILEGNQDGAFTLGKKNGIIKTNVSFDREKQAEYSFTVYASNSAILTNGAALLNSIDNRTDDQSDITTVTVRILDENDNEPKFQQKIYYAGVKYTARVNEVVLSVAAEDPDLEENGTLVYMVAASNLYKFGDSKSSGSVVPSPFNISQDGVLTTAAYMSEYNQDRFVLDIIAQEIAPPHRQAKAQVYVWVIDRTALIRMVVSRSCMEPVPVLSKLAHAGQALLVPGRRELYGAGPSAKQRPCWCQVGGRRMCKRTGDMTIGDMTIGKQIGGIQELYGAGPSAKQRPCWCQVGGRRMCKRTGDMTIGRRVPHVQADRRYDHWQANGLNGIQELYGAGPSAKQRPCWCQVGGCRMCKRTGDMTIGRRVPHVQADRRYDHWCEIHLHAVDPTTYQVLPVEKVLETIDSKYDELKDVYQEFGVETLIAASATSKAPDAFDPALAALIALLIVLFTGIVTFIVVCACLKHWVIPPPSMQSSKGDSLARRRILEELSTTENPLWLETKLRPYEEQELTMNVFGDQNESAEQPQTDNTYATIQTNRATERFGDYATLGGDSPTPLEAALGFQGSTFKPPSPDTPEPPPRPTAGLGQL
ncbi:cadherin domain-containing protein [Phthorimaea operculella]|nr:cadherin domain-containing protein [Phthorimaea operculella]